MILETDTWRMHPRGQRRTSDRANRCRGEGMIERQPLGGQSLDVGRDPKFVAVEAEVVHRVVLGHDEDKIGPLGRFHCLDQTSQQPGHKQPKPES